MKDQSNSQTYIDTKNHKKNSIILVIAFFLTHGHLFATVNNIIKQDSSIATKLLGATLPKFEIDTIVYEKESKVLRFIMNWDKLYFPFGQYNSINHLKKGFDNTTILKTQTDREDGDKRYIFIKKGVYAKFVFDNPRSDKKYFEILSAKILSPEIILCDKIRIGLKLTDFIYMFAPSLDSKSSIDIDFIKLETTVYAVEMKCKFVNGILTEITIN